MKILKAVDHQGKIIMRMVVEVVTEPKEVVIAVEETVSVDHSTETITIKHREAMIKLPENIMRIVLPEVALQEETIKAQEKPTTNPKVEEGEVVLSDHEMMAKS